MRILVVHNRYRAAFPSGEDRVVDQELESLSAAGHVVQTFGRSNDEIQAWSLGRRALVPLRVVRNPGCGRALASAIDEFRPDIVHVHNLVPLLSPSVLRACRDLDVPCVATFHNYAQVCGGCMLFRTGRECRDCVGRRVPVGAVRHGCYRGSPVASLPMAVSTVVNRSLWREVPAAYVFISEVQRSELQPLGFPPERCFVKHHFSPDPGRLAQPDGTVAFLGRLTAFKGLDVLMRAWEVHTRARPTSLRLVVAGSGPLEPRVRAWAAGLPSVEVAGHLDREAAAALVARCSAVVVPSEGPEPFGLVIAEAMAAGVAPIATARGAFPELVTDGVDGLLYAPGDHMALAALLRQVEDDPVRHAELGAAARRTYERRFSVSASIDRLADIYAYALAHPRRGVPGPMYHDDRMTTP